MHGQLPYFQVTLRRPEGDEPMPAIQFTGIEDVCRDVMLAMPDAAADLLREGVDPMACSYVIRNEHGDELVVIGFNELIRSKRRGAVREEIRIVRDGTGPTRPAGVDGLIAYCAALRSRSDAIRLRSCEAVLRSHQANEVARAFKQP